MYLLLRCKGGLTVVLYKQRQSRLYGYDTRRFTSVSSTRRVSWLWKMGLLCDKLSRTGSNHQQNSTDDCWSQSPSRVARTTKSSEFQCLTCI